MFACRPMRRLRAKNRIKLLHSAEYAEQVEEYKNSVWNQYHHPTEPNNRVANV